MSHGGGNSIDSSLALELTELEQLFIMDGSTSVWQGEAATNLPQQAYHAHSITKQLETIDATFQRHQVKDAIQLALRKLPGHQYDILKEHFGAADSSASSEEKLAHVATMTMSHLLLAATIDAGQRHHAGIYAVGGILSPLDWLVVATCFGIKKWLTPALSCAHQWQRETFLDCPAYENMQEEIHFSGKYWLNILRDLDMDDVDEAGGRLHLNRLDFEFAEDAVRARLSPNLLTNVEADAEAIRVTCKSIPGDIYRDIIRYKSVGPGEKRILEFRRDPLDAPETWLGLVMQSHGFTTIRYLGEEEGAVDPMAIDDSDSDDGEHRTRRRKPVLLKTAFGRSELPLSDLCVHLFYTHRHIIIVPTADVGSGTINMKARRKKLLGAAAARRPNPIPEFPTTTTTTTTTTKTASLISETRAPSPLLPVKKRQEIFSKPTARAEPQTSDDDTDPELLKAIELSKLNIKDDSGDGIEQSDSGKNGVGSRSKFQTRPSNFKSFESAPPPATALVPAMSDESKQTAPVNDRKRKRDSEGGSSPDPAEVDSKERAKSSSSSSSSKKSTRADSEDEMEVEQEGKAKRSKEPQSKRDEKSNDQSKSSSRKHSDSAPSSSSKTKVDKKRSDSLSPPPPKRQKRRSPSPEARTKKVPYHARFAEEGGEDERQHHADDDRMSDDDREPTKRNKKLEIYRYPSELDEPRRQMKKGKRRYDEEPKDEEEAFHMAHGESIESDSDDDRYGAEREDAELRARARARAEAKAKAAPKECKMKFGGAKPQHVGLGAEGDSDGQRHLKLSAMNEEDNRKPRSDNRSSFDLLRQKVAEMEKSKSSGSRRYGNYADDADDDDEDEYGDECDSEDDDEDDDGEEVSDLIDETDVVDHYGGGSAKPRSTAITPAKIQDALNKVILYYPAGNCGGTEYHIRHTRFSEAVRTVINLKRANLASGFKVARDENQFEEAIVEWESMVQKDMPKFFTKYFEFLPLQPNPSGGEEGRDKGLAPVELSSWPMPMRQIVHFLVALITPKHSDKIGIHIDISDTALGNPRSVASPFITPYYADLLNVYIHQHIARLTSDDREALYNNKNVWMRWATKTNEELLDALCVTKFVNVFLGLLASVKPALE